MNLNTNKKMMDNILIPTFIFVFGDYHTLFPHRYVRIQEKTAQDARNKLQEITNANWNTQFTESKWKEWLIQAQRVSYPIEQEISIEEIIIFEKSELNVKDTN